MQIKELESVRERYELGKLIQEQREKIEDCLRRLKGATVEVRAPRDSDGGWLTPSCLINARITKRLHAAVVEILDQEFEQLGSDFAEL